MEMVNFILEEEEVEEEIEEVKLVDVEEEMIDTLVKKTLMDSLPWIKIPQLP